MDKQVVNPWNWQNQYGFSQAWRVENPSSVIEVSGQTPVDGEGEIQHLDDFSAQARLAFENLKTVLEEAGSGLDDVLKVGAYLTSNEYVIDYSQVQQEYFPDRSPAQTLVVVKELALPGLMVEVEATAYLG